VPEEDETLEVHAVNWRLRGQGKRPLNVGCTALVSSVGNRGFALRVNTREGWGRGEHPNEGRGNCVRDANPPLSQQGDRDRGGSTIRGDHPERISSKFPPALNTKITVLWYVTQWSLVER
jgi:hypothetical protein